MLSSQQKRDVRHSAVGSTGLGLVLQREGYDRVQNYVTKDEKLHGAVLREIKGAERAAWAAPGIQSGMNHLQVTY